MGCKRVLAAALALLVLFAGATVLAAGSADDPLVTRSYLSSVFNQPLETYLQTAVAGLQSTLQSKTQGLQEAAEAYARQRVAASYADALGEEAARRAAQKLASAPALTEGMEARTLKKGDQITGPAGASVLFVSGSGRICGPAGSEVINITAGGVRTPGLEIRTGILYMMAADDGSGIEVTSDTAIVLVRDGARTGYETSYTTYADALKLLGLFRGSSGGYELERIPTRQEALVMLIRLQGKEAAALAYTGPVAFTDLTDWVDGQKYISFGYQAGYTTGTGGGKFSPLDAAPLEQYLTFVLRSLGYQDGVDFVWNTTSADLAVQLGLLSQSELNAVRRDGFRRDHVVLLSYRALSCPLRDGSGTLAQRLIAAGVVTQAQLDQAAALF